MKIRRDWGANDAIRDAGLTTPDDITRYDNIPYGPEPVANLLDIYCPKGTSSALPAIINIHGGGWVYGDKELYQHYSMRLAQRGFTVINFNYRLAPEHPYPAAIKDIEAVFRHVWEIADDYFIDRNNIFAVGDSAGGQLCHQMCAALTNPEYAKLCGLSFPEGFHINAVALNCGMYFFPATKLFSPAKITMIGDYLTADYRKFLPQLKVLKNMTPDFPPSFVMGAVNDGLTVMMKPLCRRMKKLGIEHESHVYGTKDQKEIGHVFHVNCKLELAAKCNDDECEFFRRHMN